MYARKLRIKLRLDSVPEFRFLSKHKIIPMLLTQKGFQDEITMITSNCDEAIVISFWDTKENADAYNHVAYLDVLRVLSKVIERVPVVESFEIIDATNGPLLSAISLKLSGESQLHS